MIFLKFQRREYKYLLTPKQHQQIRECLRQYRLVSDAYSVKEPRLSYYVASLYLDTSDYQAYWEKKYGLEKRIKYRLRTYAQTKAKNTPVFWEIKNKYADFIKKERFCFSREKTGKLLKGELLVRDLSIAPAETDTASQFYYQLIQKNLKPTVLVSYYREAWVDPLFPQFRLTFDTDIQAIATNDIFCPSRQTTILPNQVLMEVKFTGPVPGYINQICKLFNLQRQSISKYCLSLEACGIVSEEND